MSFPESVRQQALVSAARHCCVCRRYKGVGVEVHHIVPVSEGGADSLDNAIALCFDCHAAAGHYNPRHPRGTKFRPEELRKHRADWHAIVAKGGVPSTGVTEIPECHARHLLSLDNDATAELLNLERENVPFTATFIQDNDVLSFMRRVLGDDLPFTWQSSQHLAGHYWSGHYNSLADLHAENSDFKGSLRRELSEADFGPGRIKSQILRACYDSGMPLSEIGVAEVEDGGCGSGALLYYSLRRPLYTFCDFRNVSDNSIRITGLLASPFLSRGVSPRRLERGSSSPELIAISPILLQPGENLIVPTSVLLGPIHTDDLQMDWSDYESISDERGQSFGMRMDALSDELGRNGSDYFQIGPSLDIRGFETEAGPSKAIIDVHGFDPSQCYLWHRSWHVGSCPHIYFQDDNGKWHYWGEVLIDGWRRTTSTALVAPNYAVVMRLVEIEYESTRMYSLTIDEMEQLRAPILLTQGDVLDFDVSAGVAIKVRGSYECAIARPNCPLHLRQKRSLLASYAASLEPDVSTAIDDRIYNY